MFGYDFEVKSAGKHQIWGRIGYEWVRTDFDWRIDNGQWKTLKASEATCDLMPIAFWCDIAWVKFGEADLSPGKHSLQIRHKPLIVYDYPDEKAVRTLNFFDCFSLSKGNFVPN